MAHRRQVQTGSSDIRAWVAAAAREDHERHGNVILWRDPASPRGEGEVRRLPGPSRYSRLADALDAGEAVVLPGWELANYLEGPYPAMVPAFRLEPDGTVTAMRRVRHGDTVDYEPDDGPQRWRPAAELRWKSGG